MAKRSSNAVFEILARLIKAVMVVVLVPLVLGLLSGLLTQLDVPTANGPTFRQWVEWGFMTYIGVHLLLVRPETLFELSHRGFSMLAVWLFGGQVASTESSGSGGGDSGKSAKSGKGSAKGAAASQGSPLVVFSPYVVPLAVLLISALGWLASQWLERIWVDQPLGFLLGFAAAFHWIMTADELQQQRARWHVETYLLAIGLVFTVTLIIGGSSLAWSIPGFSFARALADGCAGAQAIYQQLIQRLFL